MYVQNAKLYDELSDRANKTAEKDKGLHTCHMNVARKE